MSLSCVCYQHQDGTGRSYHWLDPTDDEIAFLQSIPTEQIDAWVQQNAHIVETIPF